MRDVEPTLSSPFALRELMEEEAHEHLHHDGPGGHRHDHDGYATDGHIHRRKNDPRFPVVVDPLG